MTTSFLKGSEIVFEVNNKQFEYVHGYKDNELLRSSFNALTQRVYGFDFEDWYANGYWADNYVPHSLVYEGSVVANSSVSIIDFDFDGQKKRYVQIGTVMTTPEYRGLGLSRYLMEKIMAEWKDKCDMIYLYANDSVLSFYPKFGFEKADEYQIVCPVNAGGQPSLQKVDMDDNRNRLTLFEKIKHAKPVAKLAMINNPGLVMFYLTSFMKDNVYYISEYDTYVIIEIDDDVVYLQDIFCETEVKLEEVIRCILANESRKVVLGFTPKCEDGFEKCLLEAEDTTLFVYGNDAERFKDSKVMFPVLSHT